MIANYLPLVVDALADAALIFFVAVGLTLVFSVVRILNVAHGSFYALGAYLSVVVGTILAARGWPVLSLAALVISPLLVALALGPLIERTLLRWTYGRPEALQILVTFGLFLILEDAQKLIFGVQPYSQDLPMRLFGVSHIGGIVYLNYQLLLIVLAVVVGVGLRLLLKKSRIGKLIIAVVADEELARTVGIDAPRVFMLAFSVGVFLAALGGALASPMIGVAPGTRRRDHRAGVCRRRHWRPRPDRGRGAGGDPDRVRALRGDLFRARVPAGGALSGHGRGADRASLWTVRLHRTEADLTWRFASS